MTHSGLLWMAWLAAGCSDQESVLVRFVSQRSVPDQATALEVVVTAVSDGAELERRTYELTAEFPTTLELVRGDATPPGIRVAGRLQQGAAVVASGAAEVEFTADSQPEVDVRLNDLPQVRSSASNASSGIGDLAIDRPAGVVDGDVMIAMVAHDSGTTYYVPAPSGWRYVTTLTDNVDFGARTYVFWKAVGTTEPASYMFTPSPAYSGDLVGGMWAVSATDPTNPIGATSTQVHAPATTSCTAPSITLSGSSLLVYACAMSNLASSFTPPPGMSEDWDRSSVGGSASMSIEGAHELALAAGPTGDRSSALASAIGGDQVALMFEIVPAPAQAARTDPGARRSASGPDTVLLH